MNPYDETFLTAYLDDEVDSARRLEIEAALVANPQLAQRLRELSAVRELMAGMPRPGVRRDLAPAVLSQLERARPGRRLRLWPPGWPSLSLRGWSVAWGAGLSAAAVVLIAVALIFWEAGEKPPVATVAKESGPQPAAAAPAPAPGSPADEPEAGPASDRLRPGSNDFHRYKELVEASEPPSVEDREGLGGRPAPARPAGPEAALGLSPVAERDRTPIAQLLKRPDVRRLVIRTEALDAATLRRVRQAIGRAAPPGAELGRLTLPSAAPVDPNHPGEAIVFAVALDGPGTKALRDALRKEFPQGVEGDEPVPARVATQLAAASDLTVAPVRPGAAPLLPEPPPDVAAHQRRAIQQSREVPKEERSVITPSFGYNTGNLADAQPVAPAAPLDRAAGAYFRTQPRGTAGAKAAPIRSRSTMGRGVAKAREESRNSTPARSAPALGRAMASPPSPPATPADLGTAARLGEKAPTAPAPEPTREAEALASGEEGRSSVVLIWLTTRAPAARAPR